MLFRQLGKHGLRVKFVPSLMMVNREDCGLGVLPFLDSPAASDACGSIIRSGRWSCCTDSARRWSWLVAVAVMAIAAICGRLAGGPVVRAAGLLAYEAIMVVLLVPMEIAVRRIVRSQGGPTKWLSAKTLLRLVPAIVLTQVVYTLALLGAQFARKVDWRGVYYRIGGSWDIRAARRSALRFATPTSPSGIRSERPFGSRCSSGWQLSARIGRASHRCAAVHPQLSLAASAQSRLDAHTRFQQVVRLLLPSAAADRNAG